MQIVRPKKQLGQHFLRDLSIAERLSSLITGYGGYTKLLEIGPGTGVLTNYLLEHKELDLTAIELDRDSIAYLLSEKILQPHQLVEGDFLHLPLDTLFPGPIGIAGNFPYNISSQIFFKVLDYRNQVQEVVGMVQKEVGERITAKPGGRDPGILSILVQAFYDVKYEFTVPPHVFMPPPKVQSAVISLKRNQVEKLPCDEKLFVRLVKQSFSMRRKTMRNCLKPLNISLDQIPDDILSKRAEALSVEDFINLTLICSESTPR